MAKDVKSYTAWLDRKKDQKKDAAKHMADKGSVLVTG
jgi:predicted nucleotidyltransferase